MAKTRLNETHRGLLRDFAEGSVASPKVQSLRDKAYAKAARLVSEEVQKRFPPDKMATLAEYGCAAPDFCIRGGAPTGQFLAFRFDAADALAPMVPAFNCSSRSIPFSARAVEAIEACTKAADTLKKARDEKLTAYRSLIITARTFEDVIAVWPAAEALRDKIVRSSTSLVALSDDVVSFIRADNAGADQPQASA